MQNRYRRKGLRATVVRLFATAALLCLLAACNNAGSQGATKYTLTIEGVNCGTSPSGSVSVDTGTATAISASALAPWTWPAAGGWTVVSGTASIVNPNSLSTSVILTAGNATIRATGVDPSGYFVLTVKGVNCTTTPSGSVAVLTGSTTPISAVASPGHSIPGSNVWTVVSGSPSITNQNIASTSVTLNLGDATIQASCP
jgi:hypothetical protein